MIVYSNIENDILYSEEVDYTPVNPLQPNIVIYDDLTAVFYDDNSYVLYDN